MTYGAPPGLALRFIGSDIVDGRCWVGVSDVQVVLRRGCEDGVVERCTRRASASWMRDLEDLAEAFSVGRRGPTLAGTLTTCNVPAGTT